MAMVIAKVIEGQTVTLEQGPLRTPTEFKVKESCGKSDGHWFCVACGEHFLNQASLDDHINGPGGHVIAWICNEHGPEVP